MKVEPDRAGSWGGDPRREPVPARARNSTAGPSCLLSRRLHGHLQTLPGFETAADRLQPEHVSSEVSAIPFLTLPTKKIFETRRI